MIETENNFVRKNAASFFGAADGDAEQRVSPIPPAHPGDPYHDAIPGIPDVPERHRLPVEDDSFEMAPESVASAVMVSSVVPSRAASENFINGNSFANYVIPIASSDYEGLEKLDPRLIDRIWRLNNLYWVINEEGELIKFRLRPAQIFLLKNLHYKNIILKARQLGFTTFICIFLLDYALFNRNKQIGIIAHTKEDAAVIFRKIRVSWDNFSVDIKEFFKLEAVGDSAVEYQFTNGSILRVSTSLRSGTYQAVLITEFGKICARFPEKSAEIITGTLPAVPAKGLVFIESTAEGEEGYFYDMAQDAMEAARLRRALTVKDYKFFFFAWYQNPANVVDGAAVPITQDVTDYLDKMERLVKVQFTQSQRNWYYLEHRIQKNKMKQEHPTTPEESFLTSGNKLFKGEVVDAQREKYMQDPIEIDGDFFIYKRYVKGHLYGLGADVSAGSKRDSSTIVVIDFTTGDTVLTYRSNEVDPVNFAHDIKKAAIMYGACIAAPEANSVGMTVCVTLNAIYPNVYTQVREGLLESVPSSKLGYLTTGLTKPKYMYEVAQAMEDDELHVLDEGILLEAKRFNKEDALEIVQNEATTRHFDLLIALGIAWQMKAYTSRGLADPADVATVEARRERAHSGTKKFR